MKKRVVIVCIGLLLLAFPASADWGDASERLAQYEAAYAEQVETYKAIPYGQSSEKVADIKRALAQLGYFANVISDNYYRTLEDAIRAFSLQMKIGDSGQPITPLAQAMLADSASLPRALVPAINAFIYSYEPNGIDYTPYTFTQLSRAGAREATSVGFRGALLGSERVGGTAYCAVQMEDDPEKIVYVAYDPLPRTTVFQVGDIVSVFGVTQGEQAFEYQGMTETAPFVRADRVGYAENTR